MFILARGIAFHGFRRHDRLSHQGGDRHGTDAAGMRAGVDDDGAVHDPVAAYETRVRDQVLDHLEREKHVANLRRR
nr:hypothetical protein [Rhodoblastus sphagnicola]